MAGWDDLQPNVQDRLNRLRAALIALSQAYAGQIEATMKRDRPWTDVTGNARNRLFGRAYHTPLGPPPGGPDEFGIVAGHGMQYGIWLELPTRFARRGPGPGGSYPIVGPTVEAAWPRYRNAARELVHRTMSGL